MEKLNQAEAPQATERLLNAKQAAGLLGVSLSSIRSWRFKGILSAIMIGRCVRFRLSDLQRIMREGLPLRSKE